MENMKQDVQKTLKASENKRKGHLKIFFGYAPGVGTTYSMLKAAHQAKRRGIDVIAGFIEPHARPQTKALLNGLEVMKKLVVAYDGVKRYEFDIDGALDRKPQLILVDDLAHINSPACRHSKRYHDIEELLNSGIDVYTTLNLQNIESLNDMVESITGISEKARIPDYVFDTAHQVELIDIEPQELIDRTKLLNMHDYINKLNADDDYFTVENLTALREMAMRRCADRLNMLIDNEKINSRNGYHTDEHILVCLSSSPSNGKIIRTAARMANAFRGMFTALYVKTHDFSAMSQEDAKRLHDNMDLARQLGAKIETAYGEDVAFQIAEFARLSGVSKIVIGRSASKRKSIFSKPSLTEKLIASAPNLDIHIIPDAERESRVYKDKIINTGKNTVASSIYDILKSVAVLLCSSLIGLFFHRLGFAEANIITVYVLGVLVTSVITTHRAYSLISSLVSVLVFNFLFTEPKFTFQAYAQGYPVTFIIMFVAAFITGTLASKLKNHAKQSARSAYRTKILLDTDQLLQKAGNKSEIISSTAKQLIKLLDKDVAFFIADSNESGEQLFFAVSGDDREKKADDKETAIARWVFKNNKSAGASTDTFSDSKFLYLPVSVNDRVYGAVGILIEEDSFDSFENSILMSILGECALALENEKNARDKAETELLAKNEQLRSNLLRTISHDLRTPLTSISGNASNLISNGDSFDDDTKIRLYTDIYEDAMWLINLVENLLSVTRLEEDRLNLNITDDLMDDVIEEALRHVNRKSIEHNIILQNHQEYLLVKMDAKLMVQVIINIVDNAIKYTPKGSDIIIETHKSGDKAVVSISDNGEGMSDEMKARAFDMFYSGANKVADSRRSIGLGLALCKSIVNAHSGTIEVKDNKPHGTVFTITLPAGEVQIHE